MMRSAEGPRSDKSLPVAHEAGHTVDLRRFQRFFQAQGGRMDGMRWASTVLSEPSTSSNVFAPHWRKNVGAKTFFSELSPRPANTSAHFSRLSGVLVVFNPCSGCDTFGREAEAVTHSGVSFWA